MPFNRIANCNSCSILFDIQKHHHSAMMNSTATYYAIIKIRSYIYAEPPNNYAF